MKTATDRIAERNAGDARNALETLKKINAHFIHNYVTNDAEAHDKILHPDFVSLSTSGRVENRADYLERWKTGFDPDVIVYWDYRDEFISIFDAFALVRSVNRHVVVGQDGKETVGMTRYTDTYVCENGVWLCVQAQLTAVAPKNYPGDETIVRRYIRGAMQD